MKHHYSAGGKFKHLLWQICRHLVREWAGLNGFTGSSLLFSPISFTWFYRSQLYPQHLLLTCKTLSLLVENVQWLLGYLTRCHSSRGGKLKCRRARLLTVCDRLGWPGEPQPWRKHSCPQLQLSAVMRGSWCCHIGLGSDSQGKPKSEFCVKSSAFKLGNQFTFVHKAVLSKKNKDSTVCDPCQGELQVKKWTANNPCYQRGKERATEGAQSLVLDRLGLAS